MAHVARRADRGALPTGTVTLLFTDVERSTTLLRRLGPGYADALESHRRILRDAFARHGGHEVDTQGDAFLVAFGRAASALAFATDAQAALRAERWPGRVRMGVHTGEPEVGAEGYVGIDVHRAARISRPHTAVRSCCRRAHAISCQGSPSATWATTD